MRLALCTFCGEYAPSISAGRDPQRITYSCECVRRDFTRCAHPKAAREKAMTFHRDLVLTLFTERCTLCGELVEHRKHLTVVRDGDVVTERWYADDAERLEDVGQDAADVGEHGGALAAESDIRVTPFDQRQWSERV